MKKKVDYNPKWAVPFILILTVIVYIPVLKAGFINFDDPDYVLDNIFIKNFSNFLALITTSVQGNYHPLTMISLAINYQISGLDAWSYHLFNLIFHLLNCLLVFKLARLLSNQNFIIAFTTAILFAVHPLHVESVAWISERKDVLYTIFFLAGLYSYTKYLDTNSIKHYWYALLFLILSLLSKPAAVVFPLVLFCIDLLRRRPVTLKLFLDKIPFIIPVFVIGLLTYIAQADIGAINYSVTPMSSRIFFAFYGIMMYTIKLFLPFNLSPFYPFPTIHHSLPFEYLISPGFSIVLAIIFFSSLKKRRELAFGISFFLTNLVLVLQIIPVGSAVIAERYTYVPYIGIFFALGWLVYKLTAMNQGKALTVIITISFIFSLLAFKQAGLWQNGASLWDHVIETNPNSKVYSLRAELFEKENKLDKALDYYSKAINLNVINGTVDNISYINRGNIYGNFKKYDLAIADYRKSLSVKPEDHLAFSDIAGVFGMQGKYDSAIYYVNKSIKIKTDFKQNYSNRAVFYLQQNMLDEAVKDFEKFLVFEPNNYNVIITLANCLREQKKFQESLSYMNKAIQINPLPVSYLYRSYDYYGLNNIELAKKDALIAKKAGIKIEPGYFKILGLE